MYVIFTKYVGDIVLLQHTVEFSSALRSNKRKVSFRYRVKGAACCKI